MDWTGLSWGRSRCLWSPYWPSASRPLQIVRCKGLHAHHYSIPQPALVLHVSDKDPGKWNLALDNARADGGDWPAPANDGPGQAHNPQTRKVTRLL